MIIGNKDKLAIEIEINNYKESYLGKSAIWINSDRIGNFEDVIPLYPFFNTLAYIINNYNDLWDAQFQNHSIVDIFNIINPFFDNTDSFFDLSESEQKDLIRFDKFLFFWGENFDQWILNVFYYKEQFTFLYSSHSNFHLKFYSISSNEFINLVNLITTKYFSYFPYWIYVLFAIKNNKWKRVDLRIVVSKFLGINVNQSLTESGKILWRNQNSSIQIEQDYEHKYFRICDLNLNDERKYLDLDGNLPNEIDHFGKKREFSDSEYNDLTHFLPLN